MLSSQSSPDVTWRKTLSIRVYNLAEDEDVNRTIIDRDSLPPRWPTHRHSPEFWEQLGRTVATYGFLEEVLGKAIFAFTATRPFETSAEAQEAYASWLPTLERALTDTLKPLAEAYGKAVRDNAKSTTENVDELIAAIKEAIADRLDGLFERIPHPAKRIAVL